MEMIIRTYLKKWLRIFVCTVFFMMIGQAGTMAQPVKIYTIKDGKMFIQLSRLISDASLDSFINKFGLSDLALKKFIRHNNTDSVKLNGWSINENNPEIIAISKPLLSTENMNNTADQFALSVENRFPSTMNGLVFGINKFRRKSFEVSDSTVHFFLRNNLNYKRVMLAGSFNSFYPDVLAMQRTDSGWQAAVKLGPGKYWYKFVADGNWLTDSDNLLTENDGEGNTNSVYYKTNTSFKLDGYQGTKKLSLAGSFNNWQPNQLKMQQTKTGWELPLYLADGTYTYRFVADGNWFIDPANPDKLPNEFGEFNSVIKIGRPYLFRLNGFMEAKRVLLTGSFNGWRKDELFLYKTGTGWELPYTIGAGNYEYRFIVDGTEIADPANQSGTNADKEKANSVLILGANYTFRLKGFEKAAHIILSGDFNNFNETAYKMKREGNEWIFMLYLSPGKHLYKFIVDGKWILDPTNKLWEQNEYGTGNSVIWMDVHNLQ